MKNRNEKTPPIIPAKHKKIVEFPLKTIPVFVAVGVCLTSVALFLISISLPFSILLFILAITIFTFAFVIAFGVKIPLDYFNLLISCAVSLLFVGFFVVFHNKENVPSLFFDRNLWPIYVISVIAGSILLQGNLPPQSIRQAIRSGIYWGLIVICYLLAACSFDFRLK